MKKSKIQIGGIVVLTLVCLAFCPGCAETIAKDCFEDSDCADDDPCNGIERCSDENTCQAGQPIECSHHGVCQNESGSPVCDCHEGYQGDSCQLCDNGYIEDGQGGCIVHDEGPCIPNPCQEPYKTQCSPDGAGGYTCDCDDGYELDAEQRCVRTEYQCSEAACGALAQQRICVGQLCEDWTVLADCTDSQVCWANMTGAGCTDCELGCANSKCQGCTSGPCCDNGQLRDTDFQCGAWSEFRCGGVACGDDAQRNDFTQICSGNSGDCDGQVTSTGWQASEDCAADALCQTDEQTFSRCSTCEHGCRTDACLDCSTGDCCDNGVFRQSSHVCADWNEFRCDGAECGGAAQSRTVEQHCSGLSANCDGATTDPAWNTLDSCDSTTAYCETDESTYARCEVCNNGYCQAGACLCSWVECNEVCCAESEICSPMVDGCGAVSKLTAPDAQMTDYFGVSVDVDGDFAVVGAYAHDGVDEDYVWNSGAAYVFRRVEDEWIWVSKLRAPEPENDAELGWSVAIDGDYIVAGSPRSAVGSDPVFHDAGLVYVFRHYNGEILGEVATLTASDPGSNDVFGYKVAMDGDYIVVNSLGEDGGPGDPIENFGAVYVYHRIGTNTWDLGYKLTAPDSMTNDMFGASVSIHGDYVIVGAPSEDGGEGDPMASAGAAYVFQRTGTNSWGSWTKLMAPDQQAGDSFGTSVSLHGDYALIGASGEDGGPDDPISGQGAAYVYYRTGDNTWEQVAKLSDPDAPSGQGLGSSVAIHDDVALVAGPESGGRVNLFRRIDAWNSGALLVPQPPPAIPASEYGISIATDGTSAIVGAWKDGEGGGAYGSAYIF